MFKNIRIHFIIIVFLVACHSYSDPEIELLQIFQSEKQLVLKFQENYLDYMQYQVSNFDRKNQSMSQAIGKINKKFLNLSETQRLEYQKHWRQKFQPTIDDIYRLTRSMIVRQKQSLDVGQMAKIQELLIKMELLEKNTATAKLKPKFFSTPGESTTP